ncbi:putative membrane protein [Acorus calamus]|uniref:Membrane protein n=1 Tax=Acorus calamus TaxID=4465 RepID=A0AAV9CCL2_ACOCL|nr:putative membrane protein [Acorus calamus]
MAPSSFMNGETLLLLLLLASAPPPHFHLLGLCEDQSSPIEPEIDSNRQQIQLDRLETLINNLTETLSRFESTLSGCRVNPPPSIARKSVEEPNPDYKQPPPPPPPVTDGTDSAPADRTARAVSVTKYRPSWSERFQFVAAMRLSSDPTAANVLPIEDSEGSSKYVAVGDDRGTLYVFSSSGDVIAERPTPSDAGVTSMLSVLSIHRNESLIFTGHADGSVLAHRVWESPNGDDWPALSVGKPRTLISGGSPVLILEVYQIARTRYIVSSSEAGMISVFMENGTVIGTVASPNRPLAFMKQRLLFLTETGVGSLDLRTMTVRESECEGLNGSTVKAFAFDSLDRSKAYGITSDGDFVKVLLIREAAHPKCRVWLKKKSEMDGPVAMQVIKGYVLISNYKRVFVYNVSSNQYKRIGAPRLLFFASFEELKSQFLDSRVPSVETSHTQKPIVASDRDKLVVISLGGGYVGIYSWNFPVFKVESNTMLWSSPVLLFMVVLFGFLYCYIKEAVVWNPDDGFVNTGVVGGGTPPSGLGGPGERAYVDSPRTTDLREPALVGGGARRGPTRRYVSPSRYPGGTAIPYRAGSAEPGFRTTGELTFRGSNIETAAFPNRRDRFYAGNQTAEDHID